jgi:hypothetical protein
MYDIQDKYRMHPFNSPSDIKMFLKNPKTYKRIKIDQDITDADKRNTKSMLKGNAYDFYFSSTEQEFFEVYYLMKFKLPSDKICQIVETIYEYCIEHLTNPNSLNYDNKITMSDLDLTYVPLQEFMKNLFNTFDYQKSWGIDAKINSIVSKGDEYFRSLMESKDKIVIDIQTYSDIKMKIEEVENDSVIGNTMRILRNPKLRPDYLEVSFQEEIINEDLKIKGKLDIKITNHKAKTIKGLDVKSALNPNKFQSNYFEYRYDIQGSIYQTLLEKTLPEGYTLAPFSFLAIFTEAEHNPTLYTMEEYDLITAKTGGLLNVQGQIEGWMPIIEEIEWLKENKPNFEHRKSYYENKTIFMKELYQNPIIYNFVY